MFTVTCIASACIRVFTRKLKWSKEEEEEGRKRQGEEETFSSYSRPNFLEELVRKRLLRMLCLL